MSQAVVARNDTEVKRGRPRDRSLDDAILGAAIEELAEKGFTAFSVESVALRVNTSKATIYRRFATRDQLIEAALVRLNVDTLKPLKGASARARLLEILVGIRERHPDSALSRILRHASAASLTSGGLTDMAERVLVAPRRSRLVACIREAIDENLIRSDVDVDAVALMLAGSVIQLGAWRRESNAGEDVDVSTLLDLAMTGIAAR